jgi:hypothetical protein
VTHDPGGKVRIPIGDMSASAEFSPCGRYRHTLWRTWSPLREEAPFALWIGLNPSTADATHDDPTVRREIGHTRRMGLESLCKVNLCDWRATDPVELLAPDRTPCSPDNIRAITANASVAERVILAFGAVHPKLRGHAGRVVAMLLGMGIPLWCIGTTKDGSPRHPLYVAAATPLERWGGWN